MVIFPDHELNPGGHCLELQELDQYPKPKLTPDVKLESVTIALIAACAAAILVVAAMPPLSLIKTPLLLKTCIFFEL